MDKFRRTYSIGKRLAMTAVIAGLFSVNIWADGTAKAAVPVLDTGNTAWMITATALVLLMSIPGIALFYGGLVRQKNVLSIIMQTMLIVGVVSVLWVAIGYSWAFGTGFKESGNPLFAVIGGFDKVFLDGVTPSTITSTGIPELVFVMFQCMFALITPALILGAFAERIKFKGYMVFIILWTILAYFPMAHWVWGGGFLQEMGAGTLLNGYLKLGANLKANLDFIYSKSPMMKHRTMNSIIEEAMERKGNPNSTKASRAVDRFNEVGQLGLTWVDKVLVAGGWLGAYDKSLQENLDAGMDTALAEQMAVKAADDAVLRVQPAGDRTELPSLYRTSSEMMKIFLQFQSSLSVIWNNLVWDNIGYARNKEYGKVIGSIVAYGMAGLTLGLIADGFDDDDDAADRTKKVSYWLLTQGVESTPVFGSDISMILQRAITGEREFYGNGMDAFPGITKMLSGIESMVASDRPFLDGLKKFAEGIGIFAGFPTSGFKNLIRTAQEGPGALLGR